MRSQHPPNEGEDQSSSNPQRQPHQSVQDQVWGEKGPDYAAPYKEVLDALTDTIVEYYRLRTWDPYTAIRHSWYFSRVVGLYAWSTREAAGWLPFRPTYTLRGFNKEVLAGRLKRHAASALSDPDLMAFWIEEAYAKGGQAFSADVTAGLSQKIPQVSIVRRTFALLWDRHTPPLEFWEWSPMVAMFEHILRSKGLNVTLNEDRLKKIAGRLRLTKAEHTVVRWSRSEGRGILYFDVDAARIIGLPTGSQS